MGQSYGQFCPVAKAMELLDERWTLLIVRELLSGGERFNELRRGLPRISPTLLSARLQHLTRAGLIDKFEESGEPRYRPTAAAEELRPAIEALGTWGVRWMGELGDRDLDPRLLLWDMRRRVDHAALPAGRSVLGFTFPDVAPRTRHWWLVLTPESADVCDVDPGYPVTLGIATTLRCMVDVWLGTRSWSDAIGSGDLTVDGPEQLRRALPSWLTLSLFAPVPRPVRDTVSLRRAGR